MKITKTLLSLALSLLLVLSAGLVGGGAGLIPAARAEDSSSGFCGPEGDPEALSWTLDGDGTLTVSGLGPMANFHLIFAQGQRTKSDAPWLSSDVPIKRLVVGEGVTTIGQFAFYFCTTLETVEFPSTLRKIDRSAFSICDHLGGVDLKQVETVDFEVFSGCSSLAFARGEALVEIGQNAFLDCKSLEAFDCPETLKSIGISAFDGCKSLKRLRLNEGLKEIQSMAFFNCGALSEIDFPSYIEMIDRSAFNRTAWLDAQPEGIVYAGTTAFQFKGDTPAPAELALRPGTLAVAGSFLSGHGEVCSVTLPDGLKRIDASAFSDCEKLIEVRFPESLEMTGGSAFRNTAWLNGHPEGVVYAGNVVLTYKGTAPANVSVSIDPSATAIGDQAFHDQTGIASVELPESLLRIGQEAFADCSGLREITIPANVESIGNGAFRGCKGLKTAVLPPRLEKVERMTFYGCEALEEIAVPDGVADLGDTAFYGCKALGSVTLPATLRTVEMSAFTDCEALKTVIFGGTKEAWEKVEINQRGNEPLLSAEMRFLGKTPALNPGDVDGDAEITAADARLALRRAVELEDYAVGSDRFVACDVDHNGEVTAADARLILRAAVELEDPTKW